MLKERVLPCFALVAATLSVVASEPFHKLSFDAACKKSAQLLEKKRYDDLLAGVNPEKIFNREIAVMEMASKRPGNVAGMDEQIQRIRRQRVITTGATYFEALAGAGKTEEAKAFARKTLEFDSSSETKQRLARGAERAGNAEAKAGLQDER